MRLLAHGPVDGRVGEHDVVLATISVDAHHGVTVTLELDDETTTTLVLPVESLSRDEPRGGA